MLFRSGIILMEVRQEVLAKLYREKWAELIDGRSPFAIFENGTCVVLPAPEEDLCEQAKRTLQAFGPSIAGGPSAHFRVTEFDEGWIVSFEHPDILCFVALEEFYEFQIRDERPSEMLVGLCGRYKRDVDLEKQRPIFCGSKQMLLSSLS